MDPQPQIKQPQSPVPIPLPPSMGGKVQTISRSPVAKPTQSSKPPSASVDENKDLGGGYKLKMADPLGRLALGVGNEYGKEAQTALATQHRYASANSSDKATKIAALKDVTLDPHQIADPHDSLAQTYNRWKTVAASTEGMSEAQKANVASNYYKTQIAPFYAKLGIPNAMPESLWQSQAYSEHGALGYEVEDSFHSEVVSGIIRAGQSIAQQLEQGAETVTNMLGYGMRVVADAPRALAAKMTENFSPKVREYRDIANWHDHLVKLGAPTPEGGFFERAKAVTQSVKDTTKGTIETPYETLAHDSRVFEKFSAQDEFWHNVNPAKSYTDSITSGAVEMLASLPLFSAIQGGMAAVGADTANLTRLLGATAKGKFVAKALINGGEGLAYGTLTRPMEDKTQSWKDALSFAAMGSVFYAAGEKLKLGDVLRRNAGESPEAAADLKAHDTEMERVRLSVEDKKRPATPDEKRAAYVKEHASNMSVMGEEGQREVYKRALRSLIAESQEKMSPEAVEAEQQALFKEDPVKASPYYSARSFINDVLNGRNVSDVVKTPEGQAEVREAVWGIMREAKDHLNRAAEPIAEANKVHGTPDMSKPGTKITMASFMEKAKKEPGAQYAKPAEIEAMAKDMYEKAQAKAAAYAEAKRTANPKASAKDIAEVRSNADAANNKSAIVSKSKGKPQYGLPANASASHNANYMTYLKGKVPSLKPGELSAFYEGMADDDFAKDLKDHFYPKDLAKAGIFFEKEGTVEGKQDPNFLAFMYNYKDQMPKELGEEVSRRLEDSLKFEQHFKGYRITEDQKWHYALQMYNHVDTFVGSTSFLKKGQLNIFRSTQSNLLNPTQYQKELLQEMHTQNKKLLRDMFPKPKARAAAIQAYTMLSSQLDSAFAQKPTLASALKFRGIKDSLDTHMMDSGKAAAYPMIPWRF